MKVTTAAMPPPQAAWPLPSPPRKGGRSIPSLGQRLALVSLLALLAAAGLAMAANFAWPWAEYEDRLFHAGRNEQFPPGTVTSFAAAPGPDGRPAFYVVRLGEGELLAFLDRDPRNGCTVEYLPDLVFDGLMGWFRELCHWSTYDMAGQRVYGPSPYPLYRLDVEVRGSGVYVDPNAITRGGRWEPRRYESESGGALLFPPFTLPPASSTR